MVQREAREKFIGSGFRGIGPARGRGAEGEVQSEGEVRRDRFRGRDRVGESGSEGKVQRECARVCEREKCVLG